MKFSRHLTAVKCFSSFLFFCLSLFGCIANAQSTNQFDIRMLGVAGTETVSLQVGGTTVKSWTLTKSMASYTASSTLSGEVRVAYTNDASGRDVRVDYIVINGTTLQAENQATNTGSYNNGCGKGSYSEWMYCGGYISFGNVSAPASSAASSVRSSVASSIASSVASSVRSSLASSIASSSSSSVVTQPGGTENSGVGCYVPAMPAYSSLTSNAALPNPFKLINGNLMTTKYEWTCRRAEVSKQLQTYELGEKPDASTATVTATSSGNTVAVTVTDQGKSISFNATVQLPTTGTAPYPAIIGIGGSSLDNTAILNRGVAIITLPNDDIAQQTDGSSRGKGKFYTLYGSGHGAGAMSAWAWGASRLIDALEKTPAAKIDTKHLGVTGCSRNGKGATVAGALDERFALTIAQESGSGGSAAWRVSDAQKAAGQNVQTLSEITGENVWFRSSFSQFNNTANLLPFDHHQLLGLIAPRGLLVIENTSMEWLGNVSTYTDAVVAREIWIAMGLANNMGVSQVGNHNHCAFPSSQLPELNAFVDKFLKGVSSANTNVVKTDGTFTVDRAKWVNWATPNLQ